MKTSYGDRHLLEFILHVLQYSYLFQKSISNTDLLREISGHVWIRELNHKEG